MAGTPLYTALHFGFGLSAGAHAATTRITYTVPAGKIARVTSGFMYLGEPAAFVINTLNINLVINGVVQQIVSNIAAAGNRFASIGVIDLNTADVILIQTINAGAAAAVFSGNFQIREFS